MSVTAIRLSIFTLLPLLMAGGLVALDKASRPRERGFETFLIYLFGLGVAGSGIGGFFAHIFMADVVAEPIGWPSGNPFQLEVGFANLAVGILGIVATGRRDGFREATVIAATVFGVGATIVHLVDVAQTGNLAPGNTLQNVSNILRLALLIGFLIASRRLVPLADAEHQARFVAWRQPRAVAAGVMTGIVATGFGVGFATGQPVLGTPSGVLVGVVVTAIIVARTAAVLLCRIAGHRWRHSAVASRLRPRR